MNVFTGHLFHYASTLVLESTLWKMLNGKMIDLGVVGFILLRSYRSKVILILAVTICEQFLRLLISSSIQRV